VVERPEVISLAGGMPAAELFPAAELAAEAATVLAEDPSALQYSATEGFGPLREWVAARHGARPEQVVVTHGSQQALELVFRVTVDPGGPVGLPDPGYVGAIQAGRLAGAELHGIPGDADGIRVDALEDRLRSGWRPGLVYVVPNFDNPTGAVLSLERRRALAALAERYGFVVLEDDPYGELRFDGPALPAMRALSERVVTVGTFSKVVCPGLRVGYAIAPVEVAQAIVLVKQAADLHTGSLTQRMVHRLVSRPGFLDAHVARLRDVYRRRAGALVAALGEELGGRVRAGVPRGGMFVWAEVTGPPVDTAGLLDRAVAHGVAYVPGSAFGVENVAASSMRLSFATVPPDQLREGVRRLAAVLEA